VRLRALRESDTPAIQRKTHGQKQVVQNKAGRHGCQSARRIA
jgi:hypothetical protein